MKHVYETDLSKDEYFTYIHRQIQDWFHWQLNEQRDIPTV